MKIVSLKMARTQASAILALVAALTFCSRGGPVTANPSQVGTTSTRWAWPTGEPVEVLRAFDPPEQPWLSGHRGVDLKVNQGTPIRAVDNGTVVAAGTVVDRGVVSVRHPNGIRSTYEPLLAEVHVGEVVDAGQQIGVLQAHLPGSPHSLGSLHLGAKLDSNTYLDPLSLLLGPASLKAWE